MRKIKYLVVHHSDGDWGSGDYIIELHKQMHPQWKGTPGYHAVICNGFLSFSIVRLKKPLGEADGRVDRIWPEDKVSNGCRGANGNGLHVCLIGNFDVGHPTARQTAKLLDLLIYWCRAYKLDSTAIYGHGEMMRFMKIENYSKTCPGKNIQMDGIRGLVAERLKK